MGFLNDMVPMKLQKPLILAALVVGLLSIVLFFNWSRKLDSLIGEFNPRSEAGDDGGLMVDITLVQDADKSGAVCLDGTLPAYHLHRGSRSGSRNWLIYLQGGGWCTDHASCALRTKSGLGSSNFMEKQVVFYGILGDSPARNPDFYNWNKVKVRYCDGASFSGNVEKPEKDLMYRGQRIWRAVIQDLLSKGMMKAEKALLAGCSAGGLAALLHCNSFKEFLPQKTVVKCLSDGGYFMDVKDLSGEFSFRSFYKKVVDLQNVTEVLQEECVKDRGEQCFFPEYFLPFIQPDVFLVNPAYDIWQIQNVLLPKPAESWKTCKRDPYSCSESQLEVIQGFKNSTLESLNKVVKKPGWSMFINSCFIHCQLEKERTWNGIKVRNKTIQQSVGDWFFERDLSKTIDCSYPCNPTCIKWLGWGN